MTTTDSMFETDTFDGDHRKAQERIRSIADMCARALDTKRLNCLTFNMLVFYGNGTGDYSTVDVIEAEMKQDKEATVSRRRFVIVKR